MEVSTARLGTGKGSPLRGKGLANASPKGWGEAPVSLRGLTARLILADLDERAAVQQAAELIHCGAQPGSILRGNVDGKAKDLRSLQDLLGGEQTGNVNINIRAGKPRITHSLSNS
jgi:hypothetical protein